MKNTTDILKVTKEIAVIEDEDYNFLVEHKEHLNTVLEKSFMWRTDLQKQSIVSDSFHPTPHGKFHQSILEQKVQFEQSLYLAKEFEMKKLDIEEKKLDIEEADATTKRGEIKLKRLNLELSFMKFELNQMKIAMSYRMAEVRGWQEIIDSLKDTMLKSGVTEEEIWDKQRHEIKEFFYLSLNRVKGVKVTKDVAEYNNIIGLARAAFSIAKDHGMIEELCSKCNAEQIESLKIIGAVKCK